MIVDIVYLLHNEYGTIEKFNNFRKKILQFPKYSQKEIRIVLLLKGFSHTPDDCIELANVIVHVPNCGRDIASYFFYAEQSNADIFVFFNTSSDLISEKFLISAIGCVVSDDIGLAGATGSFAGIVQPIYFVNLWRHGLCSCASAFFKFIISAFFLVILKGFGYSAVPHIRTNAFAIRKELFLKSKTFFRKNLNTKLNSLMFESGRKGLSGFVKSLGLEIVVVDLNGKRLTSESWVNSNIYAIGNQENLAVKDNRTLEYSEADDFNKKKIYLATWCSGKLK